MGDFDDAQNIVWSHPADKIYSIQVFYEGKWSYYYMGMHARLMTYDEALVSYNSAAGSARLVEVSRYLVDGELIVTKVMKMKEVK